MCQMTRFLSMMLPTFVAVWAGTLRSVKPPYSPECLELDFSQLGV